MSGPRVAAGARRLLARQPGFTLVEVLVALLIMAVIAAMGWQGVSGMAKARDIGSAASERTLRLSALIGQWEQDLLAVYDSPVAPGVSFDGASLRIVRRVDGGVQVVVWSLREGVWRRWTSPVATRQGELQQSWQAGQQLQGPEPGQLRLLENVTEWQVYFWRGQGWSNAQSSGDVVATATALVTTPVAVNTNTVETAAGTNTTTNTTSINTIPSTNTNPTTATNATNAVNAAAPVLLTSQLPTGVRLQIDLPEGRILRDVMLSPHSP